MGAGTPELLVEGIESVSDGFAILDAQDRVLFANAIYRRLYPLVAPWSGQGGEEGIVEIGGEERWIRVVERAMKGGTVLRQLIDISEQKRREADLLTTRMRLREAVESLEEGFALFDSDDRLVLCNGRYRAIFTSIADIVTPGTSFETLTRAAVARGQNVMVDADAWFAERMAAHRACDGVFEHQFSDGRTILARERKTADGHTLATYSDITALKRREAHLHATVDNIAEALLVLDAECRISALNRSALAMFSGDGDEPLARERIAGFVAEHLAQHLHLAGPAAPPLLEHRTEAGKVIEIRPRPMPDGGFVVTFADITERTAAAERQHQSQKLEALGHLAGGVAHEFNNLLTAIGGFAKMALRRLERIDYVRECVEEIVASSDRAADLTRQMLAFGRKQPLDARIVRPAEIVRGLDRMLQTLVPEAVALTLEIGDADAAVEVDPSQLSQAVFNLALNARDAMPDGGRLVVGTRIVTAPHTRAVCEKGLAGTRCAAIFVRDTGTGIASADLAHIFEPFFTTKAQGKGTGLGLSVVHSFVERSGGVIDVATEPGRGTTFSIYLPLSTSVPQTREESFATARGRAESIIVIADEPGVRNLAYAALTQHGFQCARAADGAEAFAIAARAAAAPDLLLTDIVVPGKSGFDIAAEFRARYPALKILYMSSHAGGALPPDAPAAPCLQKPFSPEHLAACVRAVLGGAALPPAGPVLREAS